MTTLDLFIICAALLLLALVLAGAVVLVARERSRPAGDAEALTLADVGSTVVVHTRDGQSVKGVVTGVNSTRLVVADGQLLEGDKTIPLSGGQRIPTPNVAWIQELSPSPADA